MLKAFAKKVAAESLRKKNPKNRHQNPRNPEIRICGASNQRSKMGAENDRKSV